MSWFGGNTVPVSELDNKIQEATSESIPNGEIDIAVALEITDLIRSRKLPAKQCMRSLKKRLTNTYNNPNLLVSTMKLIDLCVKNGGYHFLVELTSKEFIDYLIDYVFKVHYNTKDYKIYSNESKNNVGQLILKMLKEWSFYFQNQLQLNYVEKVYNQLVSQGFDFPALDSSISQLSSTFVDSDAPPDWVDSDECMICYNAFSVINRKHHCRSCGGVFCQTHSAHSVPLVHLGIMEPVRVCDNCYEKIKSKNAGSLQKVQKSVSNDVDEEDDQLRKAIELSLKESGVQVSAPAPAPPPPQEANDEEEDEEMKAAIAASLREFEAQEKLYKSEPQAGPQQPQQAPAAVPDFYSNILPNGDQMGQAQFSQMDQPALSSQAPQPTQFQAPQMTPQKTKPVEDLTQKEEESINLFITLMTQTKNDPHKRANVVYDSKLTELYNNVILLKPKLNKSLRNAIERYEHFFELNNKISTITRLYDQFLEAKLNKAYNSHYIGYNPNQSTNQIPGQGYVSGQTTGPYPNQQFSSSNIAPQSTEKVSAQPSGPYSSIPYPIEDTRSQSFISNGSYSRGSPVRPQSSNFNGGFQEYQQPSFPPEDSEDEQEEVASRYPEIPAEDRDQSNLSQQAAPQEQVGRVQSAGTRYPPIERIDSGYSKDDYAEMPTMPSMPSFSLVESAKSSNRQKAEPEPLIDL